MWCDVEGGPSVFRRARVLPNRGTGWLGQVSDRRTTSWARRYWVSRGTRPDAM